MNKKMREIMAQIQAKTAEAKSFMEGDNKDVTKANAIMDEVDNLQKEYNTEKRVYDAEQSAGATSAKSKVEPTDGTTKVDPMVKFAQDARSGFKSLNEGTSADGGYTVPEDIQTRVNEYRDAKASLLNLVRVEKVKTNKGSRTFKKRSQQSGFSKVGESTAIGAKTTPQFERISYEIGKYAGYFPVTNEALEDSDANLAQILVEWIGDESRVTANKLILGKIADIGVTELTNLDGIKKALNVTLGSAFKSTSKIITNDNGLQYLDTLKDTTGRYLLTPVPGDTLKMGLQVGASIIPVVAIPNADMPNNKYFVKTTDTTVTESVDYYTESKGIYSKVDSPATNPKTSGYYVVSTEKEAVPFIIGDLNEAVQYWDRKQTTIKISDIAQVGDLNAFEDDLTLYRAIEREDVTTRDTAAIVNGFIALDK